MSEDQIDHISEAVAEKMEERSKTQAEANVRALLKAFDISPTHAKEIGAFISSAATPGVVEMPVMELVGFRMGLFILFNLLLVRVVRGRFLHLWFTLLASVALPVVELMIHWQISILASMGKSSVHAGKTFVSKLSWGHFEAPTESKGISTLEFYVHMSLTMGFAFMQHLVVPFIVLFVMRNDTEHKTSHAKKAIGGDTSVSSMMSSMMSQLSAEMSRKMKEAMSPAAQPVASASAPVLIPTQASTVVGMDSEGVIKQEEDSEPQPGTTSRPVKPNSRQQKSVTLPRPYSTVGSHPVNFMQNSAGALASRSTHPPASAPSPIPSGFASYVPYQF